MYTQHHPKRNLIVRLRPHLCPEDKPRRSFLDHRQIDDLSQQVHRNRHIVAYSVETSGTFDLDSELEIYFSSLGRVRFEFTGSTATIEISRHIPKNLL